MDQWKSVLWSDNSKFEIFGSNRSVFVRRREGDRMVSACVVPTVKHEHLPNLNPIETVWDELDRRVKEKQPTSAQHLCIYMLCVCINLSLSLSLHIFIVYDTAGHLRHLT